MITTALFDLDGTLVDTEPQYDDFWGRQGGRILGVENEIEFARKVKGQTLKGILATHFANVDKSVHEQITQELYVFESTMSFPLFEGVLDALEFLKKQGIKTALVTSSPAKKLEYALTQTGLKKYFDTTVCAADVTEGKPSPQCYLLASQKLCSKPEECIVFEDAIAGLKSGRAAGMRVVGVKTNLADNVIEPLSDITIDNFKNFSNSWQQIIA